MSEHYNFEQVLLEKSDLKKLKFEVLDHGPEASLPRNLPDDWLIKIVRDIEELQKEQNENHDYLTAPLAVIVNILSGKHGEKGNSISFSPEELFKNIQYLHFEISLELVRRHTGLGPEAASLETIFSNRELHHVRTLLI